MLKDINGNTQPALGRSPHWSMLHDVMAAPTIFEPLQAEVVRLVAATIAGKPSRPFISSRQTGAGVLDAIGSA